MTRDLRRPSHALPGDVRRHRATYNSTSSQSGTDERRKSEAPTLRRIAARATSRKATDSERRTISQPAPSLDPASLAPTLQPASSVQHKFLPEVEVDTSILRNSAAYVRATSTALPTENTHVRSESSWSTGEAIRNGRFPSFAEDTPGLRPNTSRGSGDFIPDLTPRSVLSIDRLPSEIGRNQAVGQSVQEIAAELHRATFGARLDEIVGTAMWMYYDGSGSEMLNELGKVAIWAHNIGFRTTSARAHLWHAIILNDLGDNAAVPEMLSEALFLSMIAQPSPADCYQLRRLFPKYAQQVWQHLETIRIYDAVDPANEAVDLERALHTEAALRQSHQWTLNVTTHLDRGFSRDDWPDPDIDIKDSVSVHAESSPSSDISHRVRRLQGAEQEIEVLRTRLETVENNNARYKAERQVFGGGSLDTPLGSRTSQHEHRDFCPIHNNPSFHAHTSTRSLHHEDKDVHKFPLKGDVVDSWLSEASRTKSPYRKQWGTPRSSISSMIRDSAPPSARSFQRRHSADWRRHSSRASSCNNSPRVLQVRNQDERRSSRSSSYSRYRPKPLRRRLPSMQQTSGLKNPEATIDDDKPGPVEVDESGKIYRRFTDEQRANRADKTSSAHADDLSLPPASLPSQRTWNHIENRTSLPINKMSDQEILEATQAILSETFSGPSCIDTARAESRRKLSEKLSPHTRPCLPNNQSLEPDRDIHTIRTGFDSASISYGQNRRPSVLTSTPILAIDPEDLPLTDTPSPTKLEKSFPDLHEHQEQKRRSISRPLSTPMSPADTSYEVERRRSIAAWTATSGNLQTGGNATSRLKMADDGPEFGASPANLTSHKVSRSSGNGAAHSTQKTDLTGTENQQVTHSSNNAQQLQRDQWSREIPSSESNNREVTNNFDMKPATVGKHDLPHPSEKNKRWSTSSNNSVTHTPGAAPFTPSSKSSPSAAISCPAVNHSVETPGQASMNRSSKLSAVAQAFIPQGLRLHGKIEGLHDVEQSRLRVWNPRNNNRVESIDSARSSLRISRFLLKLQTEQAASRPAIPSPLRRGSQVDDEDIEDERHPADTEMNVHDEAVAHSRACALHGAGSSIRASSSSMTLDAQAVLQARKEAFERLNESEQALLTGVRASAELARDRLTNLTKGRLGLAPLRTPDPLISFEDSRERLPNGWERKEVNPGSTFYVNHHSGIVTRTRPCNSDAFYSPRFDHQLPLQDLAGPDVSTVQETDGSGDDINSLEHNQNIYDDIAAQYISPISPRHQNFARDSDGDQDFDGPPSNGDDSDRGLEISPPPTSDIESPQGMPSSTTPENSINASQSSGSSSWARRPRRRARIGPRHSQAGERIDSGDRTSDEESANEESPEEESLHKESSDQESRGTGSHGTDRSGTDRSAVSIAADF